MQKGPPVSPNHRQPRGPLFGGALIIVVVGANKEFPRRTATTARLLGREDRLVDPSDFFAPEPPALLLAHDAGERHHVEAVAGLAIDDADDDRRQGR